MGEASNKVAIEAVESLKYRQIHPGEKLLLLFMNQVQAILIHI